MADSALEPAERAFLQALNELGVRYLIFCVTAASMQGARVATEDIDLWFEDLGDQRIGDAANRVGGVFVPGHFGMQPPLTLDGLQKFAAEYTRAKSLEIDGIQVMV